MANNSEAEQWLKEHFGVSREILERLELLCQLLIEENQRQNLIAKSTVETIWLRHIIDSAQLLLHIERPVVADEQWLDLGSGAGFPGLVVAMLAPCQMILVESRRKRIKWLEFATEKLALQPWVSIAAMQLERVKDQKIDYISARAFAPLPKLLKLAGRFSKNDTVWLLPKGQNAKRELQEISPQWRNKFHVKQSATDERAAILTAVGQFIN